MKILYENTKTSDCVDIFQKIQKYQTISIFSKNTKTSDFVDIF